MPCYHPVTMYRGAPRDGERPVVFDSTKREIGLPEVKVPCGNCVGCRLERSRQWAVRCMHEASLYEDNCFLTLTYADEFLPPFNSLDRTAFPRFMKRLRKRYAERRVRYYHCGEYGSEMGRPHYHALLFGFDFPDKVLWTERGGFPIWRSPSLEALWSEKGKPLGLTEIGSVTFESASYVARYLVKKSGGPSYYFDSETGEYAEREAEYVTMSRRPGIGRVWYDHYRDETYRSDSVLARGVECKPPRYYDKLYESENPSGMELVRRERMAARDVLESSRERLAVREKVAEARVNLIKGVL